MTNDFVILMSENDSNGKSLIKLVIQHINKFVLTFADERLYYCVTLDGQKSSFGVECLRYSAEVDWEAVKVLRDTNHLPKNCDKKSKNDEIGSEGAPPSVVRETFWLMSHRFASALFWDFSASTAEQRSTCYLPEFFGMPVIDNELQVYRSNSRS